MSTPTKKQLASRHIRRLRTIRVQVIDMCSQWEDLDQFCVNELDALANAIENTASLLMDDQPSESQQ